MKPVVGIFVGGAASRMGGIAKGLLPAPESSEPLVVRLARMSRELGLVPVLVGDHASYRAALPALPVICDDPPGIGPLGGLGGLLSYAGDARAIALACDLPRLSSALLARLAGPTLVDTRLGPTPVEPTLVDPQLDPTLVGREPALVEPTLVGWAPPVGPTPVDPCLGSKPTLVDPHVLAPRSAIGKWEPLFAAYDAPRVRPLLAASVQRGVRSFQELFRALTVAELSLSEGERSELVDWDSPDDMQA